MSRFDSDAVEDIRFGTNQTLVFQPIPYYDDDAEPDPLVITGVVERYTGYKSYPEVVVRVYDKNKNQTHIYLVALHKIMGVY